MMSVWRARRGARMIQADGGRRRATGVCRAQWVSPPPTAFVSVSLLLCSLLFLVRLLVFDRLIEVVQVVDLILSCASLLFFSVLGVPGKAIVLCRNKIKLNHLV